MAMTGSPAERPNSPLFIRWVMRFLRDEIIACSVSDASSPLHRLLASINPESVIFPEATG
jgi:hypothetical protein